MVERKVELSHLTVVYLLGYGLSISVLRERFFPVSFPTRTGTGTILTIDVPEKYHLLHFVYALVSSLVLLKYCCFFLFPNCSSDGGNISRNVDRFRRINNN